MGNGKWESAGRGEASIRLPAGLQHSVLFRSNRSICPRRSRRGQLYRRWGLLIGRSLRRSSRLGISWGRAEISGRNFNRWTRMVTRCAKLLKPRDSCLYHTLCYSIGVCKETLGLRTLFLTKTKFAWTCALNPAPPRPSSPCAADIDGRVSVCMCCHGHRLAGGASDGSLQFDRL